MNVYDWDKTIVPFDSTAKFYFYCLKKDLSLLKHLPYQLKGFILYFFKKIDKTEMKSYLYVFVPTIKDIEARVNKFWQENIQYVNDWYKKQQRQDDIVISASPYFLIKPACDLLDIKTLFASQVDSKTGKVLSKNCSSQEKVNVFLQAGYKKEEVEEFYSDSYNDRYFASIAKQAYLVKGQELKKWDKF